MKTYVAENKLDTQVPTTQDKWPVNFNLLLSLRVGDKVSEALLLMAGTRQGNSNVKHLLH